MNITNHSPLNYNIRITGNITGNNNTDRLQVMVNGQTVASITPGAGVTISSSPCNGVSSSTSIITTISPTIAGNTVSNSGSSSTVTISDSTVEETLLVALKTLGKMALIPGRWIYNKFKKHETASQEQHASASENIRIRTVSIMNSLNRRFSSLRKPTADLGNGLLSFYFIPETLLTILYATIGSSTDTQTARTSLAVAASCMACSSVATLLQSSRFQKKGFRDPQNLIITAVALIHLSLCVRKTIP